MQGRRETRLSPSATYLRCLNALLFSFSFIFVFLSFTRGLFFFVFRFMFGRSDRGGVDVVGCSVGFFSWSVARRALARRLQRATGPNTRSVDVEVFSGENTRFSVYIAISGVTGH